MSKKIKSFNAVDCRDDDTTDVWLTPPELVKSLGRFDLDPCAPEIAPFRHAPLHYTEKHNGLLQPWVGRVWCNPPYGKAIGYWLDKCAAHGNAVALVFARVETKAFQQSVWRKADGILFVDKRIKFYNAAGVEAVNSPGAPSCLIAYGEQNVEALRSCDMGGALVDFQRGVSVK